MHKNLPSKAAVDGGESVFRLALQHREEAIAKIVDLMHNADSHKTQLMAAMVLLDYGRRAAVVSDEMVVDAKSPLELQRVPTESEKDAMREARIKVLELVNAHPDAVYTAPMLADQVGVPKHLLGPVLAKLVTDRHIERGGPGMYKAKAQGAA
jgi:hypothetical protein